MTTTPRVMMTVYANEEHEADVAREIAELYNRLQYEHPDWGFDVDGDWDEVDEAFPEITPECSSDEHRQCRGGPPRQGKIGILCECVCHDPRTPEYARKWQNGRAGVKEEK